MTDADTLIKTYTEEHARIKGEIRSHAWMDLTDPNSKKTLSLHANFFRVLTGWKMLDPVVYICIRNPTGTCTVNCTSVIIEFNLDGTIGNSSAQGPSIVRLSPCMSNNLSAALYIDHPIPLNSLVLVQVQVSCAEGYSFSGVDRIGIYEERKVPTVRAGSDMLVPIEQGPTKQ